MRAHHSTLVQSLLLIVGNVREHSTLLTLKLCDLLVQCFHNDLRFLWPVIAKLMQACYLRQ